MHLISLLASRRKYAGKDATEEYEVSGPMIPAATARSDISDSPSTLLMLSRRTYVRPRLLPANPPKLTILLLVAAAEKYIGPLAASSIKTVVKEVTQEEQVRQDKLASLPPLDEILSLHDFEALAKETMSDKAWAYYSSGADDEITMVRSWRLIAAASC